ncbi:unnamed protein product [Acanthoscelides obtectus]|uniref:Uncharacterized protein n=1 Tax=Acanthoscelides obtectus TaxID=200917 RepID=A0A9P0LEW2_ACAOB|nr:unnamed protein product [Acanthoscelides obtectus]CAK1629618.1 hypothetical protein AOBTE_LOCUS5852 [Acanthoscelides obtectus]
MCRAREIYEKYHRGVVFTFSFSYVVLLASDTHISFGWYRVGVRLFRNRHSSLFWTHRGLL